MNDNKRYISSIIEQRITETDPISDIESKVGLKEEVNSAMTRMLNSKEIEVITLRFGLDGNGIRTLQEVGDKFNLTSERIRQIEGKALRKLRHPVVAKPLREFTQRGAHGY